MTLPWSILRAIPLFPVLSEQSCKRCKNKLCVSYSEASLTHTLMIITDILPGDRNLRFFDIPLEISRTPSPVLQLLRYYYRKKIQFAILVEGERFGFLTALHYQSSSSSSHLFFYLPFLSDQYFLILQSIFFFFTIRSMLFSTSMRYLIDQAVSIDRQMTVSFIRAITVSRRGYSLLTIYSSYIQLHKSDR